MGASKHPEIAQSIGDRCFRTGRPRTVARPTQLDELSRTSYWKGGLGPLAQKSFRGPNFRNLGPKSQPKIDFGQRSLLAFYK